MHREVLTPEIHMQKSAATFVFATLALIGASIVSAQQPAPKVPGSRISPHETVSQVFDGKRDNRIVITYGRPYSKDPKTGEIRKVWGTLVPHGKVWRTGSDEATTLTAQVDFSLGGTALSAGAYTLDLQPEADGSAKLIVGKRLGSWGVPYNGANSEVARIDMKKSEVADRVDQFTIKIDKDPAGGGVLTATWENTQYSLPIAIKK